MKSSNQVKTISSFLVSLFIILTIFVINVNAAQLIWTLETVDAAENVGEWTSLAIDSVGNLHVSYWDQKWNNLKYAKLTGSIWTITPVDTVDELGYLGTSIAVDTANNPHISYYDYTHGDLKYAQWIGSTWSIQTVDSVGNVGLYSSIAIDSNSRAHISYYDYEYADLKYAQWTGTTWSIQTVDSGGQSGLTSSVAIDSNDRPHIAYHQLESSTARLKYARWTGTAWIFETVEAGYVSPWGVSLKLDKSNYPHISYCDAQNPQNPNLKYATKTGSTWNSQTVDASEYVGTKSSLALDTNDYPHIAYYDTYWQDLKYAKLTDQGWFFKNIDNIGFVGNNPSLVLDSTNHPHIVYRDETNKNLKYARNPNETFNSWIFSSSDSDGDSNKDLVEVTFDVDTTFSGSLSVYVSMVLRQTTGPVWAYNSTTISITSTLPDSTTLSLMLPQEAPPGPYELYVWLEDDGHTIEDTLLFAAGTLYPPQNSQVGYLTGTVTDADTGLPLSGIDVLINGGELWFSTNSSGQYYIELVAGFYNVTFQDGSWFYDSITVTDLNVDAGSITTLDAMLEYCVYILELQVQGLGNLDPEVGNYQYYMASQEEVEIQATPNAGWILSYWLLDSVNVGSENPFTVLMDSDHNLTAVFIEEPQVGFLAGQVKDFDTELPIPEAEVAVNGTIKLTDPAGNYELELEPGEYNITVSRLGYISETRFVTVAADAISTQDFLLQKTEFTLVIEVEGMGSTTPAAGTHQIQFGTEIVVEAFPNSGWNLGNWVFDSIWYGPEIAFPLIMDNNHELMVVFIEDTAIEPFIESCGEDGGQKDVFNQGDNMYVTGGFFASGTFEIYVVNDVETWTDGMAIPSRVSGTETTISGNLEGHIPPTNVWGNLETVGEYDIVIDVNDNGLYDVGVDALDDGDIEVTAGVEVIPEINSLTIITLLMTATWLVIIFKKEYKK